MKNMPPSSWLPRVLLPGLLVALLALPFVFRYLLQDRTGRDDTDSSGSGRTASMPSETIVIISPHWEGIKREFSRAFSKWTVETLGHETHIEWLDVGGTSDAMRFVRSEFTRVPDGINVDIFFGGGVDPYLRFAELGLLQQYKVSRAVLDQIPQKISGMDVYDPEFRWYGACLSGFGIIYNKQVLEIMDLPPPLTWEALGHKKYFSWVGSGDPRSSGSVHMVYEIILQAYGWERGWANIVRMGGNIRGFSRAASQVPKDAALGEIACGLAIDVYAWRQITEAGEDRMGFYLPEGTTVINPDGIALLKGAPNAALAGLFIEFVLSEKGQKLFILKVGEQDGPAKFELGRISVIPGLAGKMGASSGVRFDPSEWKGGFVYDSEKGSKRWTILNDLIGARIIDTHGELMNAWRSVMDLPESDPVYQRLVAPPLSERELMELAETRWDDSGVRAKTTGQWAGMAKTLYNEITGRDK